MSALRRVVLAVILSMLAAGAVQARPDPSGPLAPPGSGGFLEALWDRLAAIAARALPPAGRGLPERAGCGMDPNGGGKCPPADTPPPGGG